MNQNSLARLGSRFEHRSVKSAVFKLTNECMLRLIEPTKLTEYAGFDEKALVKYKQRLKWLRGRQKTINHWLASANRSEVQIAVVSSLTATHQHYATIVKSLIRECEGAQTLPVQDQTLFSLETVRQGEIRYVKNYQ